MTASVIALYIAQKGARPTLRPSATLEAGRGVVGDRYYEGEGTFSEKLADNRKSEVTFIAAEEIDAFNTAQHEALDYGDVRRNIVTRGVPLRDLIDREFSIGPVRFLGIEHCEPCAHLAATVNPKVLPHLAHTGLRAAILSSGTIEVGEEVSL